VAVGALEGAIETYDALQVIAAAGFFATVAAPIVLVASMVVRAGAYGKAFDRLDRNGDGAATKEEIQALAKARG